MYFVRFVLFCTDVVNDFLRKNCPYIAGAIAFYTLFSLIPLFLVVISVLAFFIPHAERTDLARQVGQVLPVSSAYMSDTVEGVVHSRAITGSLSALGLIWASTAAFSAIRKGINTAWGVKRTRPYLKERLIDIGLVLGAGVLLMAVLFSGPGLGMFKHINVALAAETDTGRSLLVDLLSRLLSPALSFLTFLTLYRFLPNIRMRYRDVWLGALAASLAFDGANWGFVWYVKTFPLYSAVYGAVGAVLALLTWVYVSAIIVLFGALVTSRYAACAAKRRPEEQGLKIILSGLSRVRVRVAEPQAAG